MALRTYLPFVLKAFVSVGLLWWLIGNTDTSRLFEHVNNITIAALMLISTIVVLTSVLLAYRWIIILRTAHAEYSLYSAIKNILIGFFFNQFLPSTVGGDAVRIWFVHRDGVKLSAGAASIVADRIHGFFGLVLLCAAGIPLLLQIASDPKVVWGVALLVLTGLGGMIFLLGLHRLPVRYQGWRKNKLIGWVGALSDAAAGALTRKEIGFPVVSISIVLHLIDLSLVYIMAVASGISLSWVECLILVPPAILVSALPISVAGWGLREGTMVVALSQVGVASADAIMLSLFFGASQMLAGLVGGAIWVAIPTGKRKVIAEQAQQD